MAISAKFRGRFEGIALGRGSFLLGSQVVVESDNMNAVVEEVGEQYKVQVPWGGAVMKMLCNDEYKFWRRRWGANAAGSTPLGISVMCSELFFIAKMSIFEVCDQSGESG